MSELHSLMSTNFFWKNLSGFMWFSVASQSANQLNPSGSAIVVVISVLSIETIESFAFASCASKTWVGQRKARLPLVLVIRSLSF